MEYLLEVDAYDPAVVGVRTLRYGTIGFMTAPGDVPSNTFFWPRLQRPGNFERAMFTSGATSGASRASFGDIELVNQDGGLDGLRKLAFDGRALRLFGIEEGQPFSVRRAVFAGTVEQAEVSEEGVVLRVRSRLEELQQDLQKTRYKGTTTAGGQRTVEGNENDLKDRPKVLAWGRCLQVPLVNVNTFDSLWQGAENPITSCEAVCIAGAPLQFVGPVQTSVAGLFSLSLGQGQYGTMLSPFIVRIGGGVSGVVTADITEGASEADRCAAQIVRRILLFAGKVEGVDFLASDVARFAAQAPAEQGVWCGPQDMAIQAPISRILAGVQGFLTEDRLGRYRMGQFREAGLGDPVVTLNETNILEDGRSIEIVATSDQGKGVPAAKITLSHTPLWQVFDDGTLQPALTADRKAFLKAASRQAVAEDASVRTRHLIPAEMVFESLIVQTAQASEEASRRLALYSARRDFVRVEVPPEVGGKVDLGDVVAIRLPRLGFDAGKRFIVTCITEELGSEGDDTPKVILELWG